MSMNTFSLIQSTPDNSNLQGKSKKVQVIMEAQAKQSKWGSNAITIQSLLQGQQKIKK